MIDKKSFRRCGSALLAVAALISCSAPRQVIHSGKVTPKGHFKAGFSMEYNIPTAAVKSLYDGAEDQSHAITGSDTIVFDSSFNNVLKTLTICSIDPFIPSNDFYLRYGVIDRIDIGYARGNAVNIFDARAQFLGPTGVIGSSSSRRWYGSIGIQYSWQKYELPSFLGEVQNALRYSLKRKDLLFPLALSRSFGEEERFGALSFGAVYGLSFISYQYDPGIVYEVISSMYQVINDVPQGKNTYRSFGFFATIKGGYKIIYGLAGLSLYYQDYGTFKLYKQKTASFSGVTVVPTLGIQFAF